MEISFKTKEQPEARTFEYDMPADLDSLNARFGAENVYEAAKGAIVISLQALARRHIEKSNEEIAQLAKDWAPGQRSAPVSKNPFERATSAIAKLSPEEKADLLARLQA